MTELIIEAVNCDPNLNVETVAVENAARAIGVDNIDLIQFRWRNERANWPMVSISEDRIWSFSLDFDLRYDLGNPIYDPQKDINFIIYKLWHRRPRSVTND